MIISKNVCTLGIYLNDMQYHERRSAPRYLAYLPASLRLIESETAPRSSWPVLVGRAVDMSRNGLRLFLPSILQSQEKEIKSGDEAEINVATSVGYINARATFVHVTYCSDQAGKVGHFVGIRINSMTALARTLYRELLQKLDREDCERRGSI